MQAITKLSVVIPAHNEQALIAQCIASVKQAGEAIDLPVEIVVCTNRCTDNTAQIAESMGARVVDEPKANVARVRNTAIAASSGDVIVTLDADSRLSKNYLQQVVKKINKGYIGGAGLMFIDRLTLSAVLLGGLLVLPALLLMRFSGGMFWVRRDAMEAINGFDTRFLTGEDLDFWRRLRRYARANGLRFGMLHRAWVVTSARKMDEFGPWFMLTHPHWYYLAMRGDNRPFADRYLYKTRRSRGGDDKS